jgi:hypothetical protein
MHAMLLSLFAVAGLFSPQTVSGNFPRDLQGTVDTRPTCWGYADSAVLPITFNPPAGYRVRILALRGDVTAWIKTLPGDPTTPPESVSGVLGGFQTTSGLNGGTTPQCDYCAGGTPLYVQGAVGERQPTTRIPFDYDNVGTLLDSDNVLNAKIASFLNTTGKPIHTEISYTLVFRYEQERE